MSGAERRSNGARILLTGRSGQLGWELERLLSHVAEVVAFDRDGLDLGKPDHLRRQVREIRPRVVINAAGYTAVDRAESEPDLAHAVNGVAPGVLAEAAVEVGAFLIHYSTDFVFDGNKTSPYVEEDEPHPLGVYGKTKLAGENAVAAAGVPHLILRTSWVYGLRGRNFLLTMERLCREGKPLRVVDDQIGTPTWSRWLAEATGSLLEACVLRSKDPTAEASHLTGIYHLSPGGETSWHGFAQAIIDRLGGGRTTVAAIPTSEFPLPAPRPAYSVLSKAKVERVFGIRIPSWDAVLERCLASRADYSP